MNAPMQTPPGAAELASQIADAHLSLAHLESHLLRVFQGTEELAAEGNAAMQLAAKYLGDKPSDDGRWETIEEPRNRVLNELRLLVAGFAHLSEALKSIESEASR